MDLGNLNVIAAEPMATSDEDDETVAVAKQLSTELLKLEAKNVGDVLDAIPVDKMTDSSSVASTNTNMSRNDTSSLSSDNESSADGISGGKNLNSKIVVAENLVVSVAAPPHVETVIIDPTPTNG